MLSPSETGTTLGATPGNVQGAGRPAPHTGTWHRRGARRKQSRATGGAWRGEAGQDPPSHTWGALSDSAPQERLLPGPARRAAGIPAAMTRFTPESTGEVSKRQRRDQRQQARKPRMPAAAPTQDIRGPRSCMISSRQAGSPASDLLALSRKHRALIGCCPASAPSGLLTCRLCTNMWMTCAQQH